MRSFPVLAACLLVPLATAQNPRSSVQVDSSVNAGHPTLATAGDLMALAFVDNIAEEVYVTTSDGKGLVWSTPVLISNSGGRKTLEPHSVHVIGDRIYVGWNDERNGTPNDEVYFNYFDGTSWTGEQRIDKNYPAMIGAVRGWSMDVSQGGSGVNVVFALAVDPTTLASEEVYVVSSQDGGASFNSPDYIPAWLAQIFDVDNVDVAAEGDAAYVVWADNQSGADGLYMQKSTNGGLTWNTFLPEKRIDADPLMNGDVEDTPVVVVDGLTVAVGWLEERPNASNDQFRARVSTNGAVSFAADLQVGNYSAGLFDVDDPTLAIASNGNVIASWLDTRTGSDQAYTSHITSPYSAWSTTDTQLSFSIGNGGGGMEIATGSDGAAAIQWSEGATPNSVQAVRSLNDGVTWTSRFQVSDQPLTTDTDGPNLVFNELYRNFQSAWLGSTGVMMDNVFAGGFRLPTLSPSGWTNGGNASFDLSGFTGNQSVALIYGTIQPISAPCLPLRLPYVHVPRVPIGGAVYGPRFLLRAGLSGAGSGSTTPMTLVAPSGTTFRAVALTLSGVGPYDVVELTDVETIVVP